jgi:hypothetical protein
MLPIKSSSQQIKQSDSAPCFFSLTLSALQVHAENIGCSEIVNPPADFEAWEHDRLRNRDLDKQLTLSVR